MRKREGEFEADLKASQQEGMQDTAAYREVRGLFLSFCVEGGHGSYVACTVLFNVS